MKLIQQFRFNLKAVSLVALIVLGYNNLFAATYYSRKTNVKFNANGVWSTSRTGSTVNFPGSGHTYIIQTGNNIKLAANQTAIKITVESGGTFTINNTYTLTSPLTINSGGTLAVNNRRLTMAGDLTNSGTISGTTGRIITNTYDFINSGSVTLTTGRIERTSGSLTNSGNITLGAGRFTATTGSFTNSNTGSLSITGSATVTLGTGNFINNNTSLDVDFGSSNITVNGTGQSIGGFTTTGLFSNTNASGTITLTGGVNAGGFTSSGAGTIDLGIANIHTISGNWNNSGGTVLGNSSTLKVSGTLSSAGTFSANTGTIMFNGAGSQTIPSLDYYNLDGTGGDRTLANSGDIGIAGDFTPGGGIYTIAGSTVNFNGTSTQTIPEFNFYNLNAIGGDRILENNGNIGIEGIFTPGAENYTVTGSTVSFISSSSQTIPIFNYNNLDGTGGDRILDTPGTIGIAGIFTPGAGAYTITNSTVSFNGTVLQTIPTFTFENLIIENQGTKEVNSSVSAKNITIGTGAIFNLNSSSGGTLNLYVW